MVGYENWQPQDLQRLYENKYIWHNSKDPYERQRANEENIGIRSLYGMGDEDDIPIGELEHYRELVAKQKAYDTSKDTLLKNITNSA